MAHKPEPNTATARAKWNKEHAREKQKVVNAERQRFRDFDSTAALNRFVQEKNQPRKQPLPPESNNQFAENIGVSTNDEVGGLLKAAINKLKTDPNDLNSQFALKGMGLLYEWENLNILDGEVGKEKTYYDFEAGKLNDQNELIQEEFKPQTVQKVKTNEIGEETKLQTEADARKDWLEKTRNSPAQQSGAWAGREEELWELSKKSGANKGVKFAPAIDEKKPIEIRKPK